MTSSFACVLLALVDDSHSERERSVNRLLVDSAVKLLRADGKLIIACGFQPGTTGLGTSQGGVAYRQVLRTSGRHQVGACYDYAWTSMCDHGKLLADVTCFSVRQERGSPGFASVGSAMASNSVDAVFVENVQMQSALSRLLPSGAPQPVLLSSKDPRVALCRSGAYIAYDDPMTDTPAFASVVLGGTFDQLHIGHRKLLTAAVAVATERLTVGVMSDTYIDAKDKAFKEFIQPAKERAARVEEFLRSIRPSGISFSVLQIDNSFGPTITEPDFDAIVVSTETLSGGVAVNRERAKRGLRQLALVAITRNDPSSLSSTALRQWKQERGDKGKL